MLSLLYLVDFSWNNLLIILVSTKYYYLIIILYIYIYILYFLLHYIMSMIYCNVLLLSTINIITFNNTYYEAYWLFVHYISCNNNK